MKMNSVPATERTKKLGDISQINYGYTEKACLEEIGPKFLRITDIQDGNVDWNCVPYCQISNDELPRYLLRNDDIVFARTGATTGKSFLVKNPPQSVFASYLIRLRILDSKVLMPEFLYLFFQTKTYWDKIQIGVSGSAQGGFNASKLSELNINLPPIDEQKRIVGILDEVFDGIAKVKEATEKNLKNAREVFESYLREIFSARNEDWEESDLGKICEIYQPKTISTKEMRHDGQYLVYGANGVIGKYDKYNHEESQLLITCRGATCGSVNISSPKAWINGNAMVVRPKDNSLNKEFLTYFFRNGSEISKTITGAAQPQITRTTLAPLKIGFPKSLSQQKSIVTKLDTLSTETKKLEDLYNQKLTHLEELKKSILKKAFNGEL